MSCSAYHIFRDNPWTGTGVGTIISVYPAYETDYDASIVDHVHNDHFELLAETGSVGAICWLTFIALLIGFGLKKFLMGATRRRRPRASTWRSRRLRRPSNSQFLADFNLHIPANALLFYLLAGVASVKSDFRSER